MKAQEVLADTIYYNSHWEICELPLARYYRVGKLVTSYDAWFYQGPVRDYSLDGRLLLEGHYAPNGTRDGAFKFYDWNGNLTVSGSFTQGQIYGIWQWFYPSGKEKASIYFPGSEEDFRFIRFVDPHGDVMLENGTGKFEWTAQPYDEEPIVVVSGKFRAGKRVESWFYEGTRGRKVDAYETNLEERYDKEGRFLGAANNRFRLRPQPIHFYPRRLERMELMAIDPFFRTETKKPLYQVLYEYLKDGRSPTITVDAKEFDSAYAFVGALLNTCSGYLEPAGRDITGQIDFRLGAAGYPEEVVVTAPALDTTEKRFLYFVMSKFRNMEMPGDKHIAMEGYHRYHFFSVDLKPFLPEDAQLDNNVVVMFSAQSRQETLKRMQADKKEIRRYIRQRLRLSRQ